MSWIAPQEFLERAASLLRIVQVVFVDLGDREQGVVTITAAGVFVAQELVCLDGGLQNLVVVETPPHFDLQLRNRHYTGVGLGGTGSPEVDASIGFDSALVVVTSALLGRTSSKGLARALGPGKLVARPSIAVPDTRMSGKRWQQR